MTDQPDDDFLDHPDSLADDADDEATQEMRPLFPEGVAKRGAVKAWKEVLGGS